MKEFKSTLNTTTLGLVPSTDVSHDKPAILFLGDSFMEGQGASPWFYRLEAGTADAQSVYQIMNGGDVVNVVPDYARVWTRVRDSKAGDVLEHWERLKQIAAASLALVGTMLLGIVSIVPFL